MKKSIKKIVEVILAIIACLSFVLMCAERPDGSACPLWTIGCMAVFAISAIALDRMGVLDRTI